VFNVDDGEKVWAYDMGNGSSSTPAIVKGLMVIATEDGHVFGFDLE
jgi:outer membrane protein assembly factor BamB